MDVYRWPYDPAYPVVCLDEASKELHDPPRGVLPLQREQPVRQDYENERHSVANLFLAIEPLRGWRKVRVTDRRTRHDFAEQLRLLADEDYPQAQRIVLWRSFQPRYRQPLAGIFPSLCTASLSLAFLQPLYRQPLAGIFPSLCTASLWLAFLQPLYRQPPAGILSSLGTASLWLAFFPASVPPVSGWHSSNLCTASLRLAFFPASVPPASGWHSSQPLYRQSLAGVLSSLCTASL